MNWTASEGIDLEVASETITHMIALYIEALNGEEKKPHPDRARAASLESTCRRLAAERRALRVHDHAEIQRIFNIYGPIVRSRLTQSSTTK